MFSCSYGGMLSAFMRFKYPNLVTGSIAASAPIFLLGPTVNRNFFFDAVTADFAGAKPNCEENVKRAFVFMDETAKQGPTGNIILK